MMTFVLTATRPCDIRSHHLDGRPRQLWLRDQMSARKPLLSTKPIAKARAACAAEDEQECQVAAAV
eukprot:1226505-Prymnesium_polylepis.1